MAKKKGNNKRKLLLFLSLPFLNITYQVAAPYMAETKKMNSEALKLQNQIRQVQNDAILYSEDWEKKTEEKERELASILPDQITPSEVSRYFATNFEREYPGVQFTSLVPAPAGQSTISADRENQNVKARVSKVQIKAKMPPDQLLNYLEYAEKYPGFSKVSEVNFTASGESKKSTLDVEVSVDLFLVPKEWVRKELDKKSQTVERTTAAATTSVSGTNWFEVGTMGKSTIEGKVEETELAPPKPPKFRVTQFVGSSIVVGDDLFEVGDQISGWRIVKVDPESRTVTIQFGKYSHKVVAK